jgi:hypothetical protein
MLIDASGHLAKAHCFRQMGAKSFAFFSSGSLLETLEDPYFYAFVDHSGCQMLSRIKNNKNKVPIS